MIEKEASIKPSKAKDLFSDDSDDIFASLDARMPTSKENEVEGVLPGETSSLDGSKTTPIKEPLKEVDLVKEVESSAKKSVKTFGKSLFNPLDLKDSNLFKKLSDKKKEEEPEEIVDELPRPELKSKPTNDEAFFDDLDKIIEKPKSKIRVVSNLENDFGDFEVDKAFSENSFKNIQKDRIQASGKKRAPMSRGGGAKSKPDTLEDEFKVPDEEPKPKSVKDSIKTSKLPLLDSEDGDDIFSSPILKSNQKTTPKVEAPPKQLEVDKKPKSKIPDPLDDDEDLFSTLSKKTVIKAEIKSEPKPEIKTETKPEVHIDVVIKTAEKLDPKTESNTKNQSSTIFDNLVDNNFEGLDLFKPKTAASNFKI